MSNNGLVYSGEIRCGEQYVTTHVHDDVGQTHSLCFQQFSMPGEKRYMSLSLQLTGEDFDKLIALLQRARFHGQLRPAPTEMPDCKDCGAAPVPTDGPEF